jgi:peptide/nickel transport system permease protein
VRAKLGLLFFCGGARVTVHSPSGLIFSHISAPLAEEDTGADGGEVFQGCRLRTTPLPRWERENGQQPSLMSRYILRRILLMVPTLLGVAVIVFLLMRVIPGDIVEMRFAEGRFFNQELVEKERARLGLDRPLWAQFVDWLWGIARLDFGLSMWSGGPISREIAIRLQLSLQLAVMATVIAVLLAIPLGTLAALRQDTWADYAIRVFSIAGLATPSFWLGILMFLFFLIVFRWIPPMVFTPFWQDPWQNLSQMIWPALAVGYRFSAVAARMTRSAMLEVLREDYIRTARAKGLWQSLIVKRHALKNAMLPVLTVIGLEFAFLMGGLVVTEQVFNLNGLGLLFVQSVARRDYTLVQALVLLVAFVYIVVNFCVDLLYAWLDPRIRYQ